MDSTSKKATKREVNRGGAWTVEEDKRLAQAIEVHGPKKWRSIALKAGLDRCGKSCRLRWMNYLRPNIKRGNISDQEEDLIIRLHKLLGNRWSLIAGRLPGRTDNEIKNYWNSHLSKKVKQKEKEVERLIVQISETKVEKNKAEFGINSVVKGNDEGVFSGNEELQFDCLEDDQFFDLSINQEPLGLEWMSTFLELDDSWFDST